MKSTFWHVRNSGCSPRTRWEPQAHPSRHPGAGSALSRRSPRGTAARRPAPPGREPAAPGSGRKMALSPAVLQVALQATAKSAGSPPPPNWRPSGADGLRAAGFCSVLPKPRAPSRAQRAVVRTATQAAAGWGAQSAARLPSHLPVRPFGISRPPRARCLHVPGTC